LTRPFDKHLDSDELDGLLSLQRMGVSDSEQISEQSLREAQRHVESCPDCSRNLQMHKYVQSEILRMRALTPSPPTPECIGDAEWLEVAAGLLPDAKTRELMKHAAQCGHCGPLLKNAAEALVDEPTPSEEAWLASLRSARPEWRKNMAETLRSSAGTKDSSREKKEGGQWWQALSAWWRPAFAVAGIAAVVLAGWLMARLLRPPSAEQLLAQAYTERRTLEVRIPGAKFAPMRVERGAGGSSLDKPPSLLKAEALIAENLAKNPNDPTWLQAKGRADLLDGSYESAIKSLQRALETDPDSPQLLTDLGSAYFLRAEAADRAIDYGNAIESLGRALAKSPEDPVALFNRALACERMFLYTQAIEDWEHYLRVEPQGEWADDVRKRLASLKEKLEHKEKSLVEPLLGPTEFADKVDRSEQSTWGRVDGRIEDYLELATRDWLPLAFSAKDQKTDPRETASAPKALEALGEILSVRHNDMWLADMMNSRFSGAMRAAAEALGRSIAANAAGNPSIGQAASLDAEKFFLQGGSRAGLLRAQMEELYSLHRLFHSSECLRVASALESALNHKHYSWMETQVRLEKFSCLDAQAKMDTGSLALAEALKLAQSSHYQGLFLRGMAFEANLETDKGNLAGADEWDHTGLAEYWSGATTPLRAYQFYDDLSDQAQRSGRWHWAVAAGRDAVRAIASTPNRSGEGMAHFQLAISLEMASDTKGTAEQSAIASRIFSGLPSNPGIRGFEGDSEIQLAEAEVSQGLTDQAESRLRSAKADIPSDLDSYGTWLTYYRTRAQIARQRGDAATQERDCSAVVAIGEVGLGTVRTERDRLTWNHATGNCYRELVNAKLRENDPLTALSIWEWYLGAAVRSTRTASGATDFAVFDDRPPSLSFSRIEETLHTLDHETVLVFAELDGRVSAWVYDDRGAYSETVAVEPTKLRRLANDFAIQCADPKADLSALRKNGRLLYDWLIAPFENRFDPKRTLIVEADGSLAPVPFQALVEPDGSYFGVHRALVLSPGLNYMLRLRPSRPVSSSMTALVVGEPTVVNLGAQAVLHDASREAEQISQLFKNVVLLEAGRANQIAILDHISSAAVFHFAGHALSSAEGTGLEVAPDADASEKAHLTLLSPDRLAAARLQNLELVVLSACSTGRAGDEGLADPADIAEAFLRNGVPHVIASRWDVDSASTAALMNSTYRALLSGRSVPSALRDVYREFSNTPATSHPYYWAAFNVFGRA
jgi:CHAT domain-containing protein/cytochrome c-type biogenesis protein CcmH/NrfG